MFKKSLLVFLVLCTTIVSTGCASVAVMPIEAAPIVIANPEVGVFILFAYAGGEIIEEGVEYQVGQIQNCEQGGGNPVMLANPTGGLDSIVCDKQIHTVTDGTEEKKFSRAKAASQFDGKNYVRCLVRNLDVLLIFDVKYSGTKHIYNSGGFVSSSTDRDTFMGFKEPPNKASLGGFVDEVPLDDSRCVAALTKMQDIIETIKQTPYWPAK